MNRQISFLLAIFLASVMWTSSASSETVTDAGRTYLIATLRTEALTGDSRAMLELGRAYKADRSTGPGLIESWVWLNIAALRQIDAAGERDQLEFEMSLEEMLAAEKECLRILALLNAHRQSTLLDPERPIIWSK